MSELLAVLLGAIATYVFDIRRSAAERQKSEQEAIRERRRHRASVATALLQDLRTLETVLLQFYHTPKPANWVGRQPSLFFDALRGEVRQFAPDTVTKVAEVFRQTENLLSTHERLSDTQRANERVDHYLKAIAAFALQDIPAAKAALMDEGGVVPEPRVLEIVQYPALPSIPPRSFPDLPASGQELPVELP